MNEATFSAVRKGFYLALAAWVFACAVVMLGSFTRLVDAGLGCPDWPGCYGHLTWPDEAHEIVAANQAYPDMPVLQDKTWPEMVHRYLAGGLGLFILGLAVIAFRQRENDDYPFRLPMLMLVLVIWQALFGMWTVTLKLWPQIVALHLMGGFITFTLLGVLTFRLNDFLRLGVVAAAALARLRGLIIGGFAVVFIQVFLGGWVASNYAAVACPDFPTCQTVWWPQMDFYAGFNFLQHVGPNYLGGRLDGDARTAIHMVHRIGAVITLVYLLFLSWRLLQLKLKAATLIAGVIGGLILLQVALGITNVLMNIPLAIAVAHNFVGALLMAALAISWLQTWPAPSAVAHD